MAPPTLVSIPRGTTPAHYDLPASADTTAVGTESTTAADVAVRLGDVADADDDDDRRHVVAINGIELSAKSAGIDECHFRSHFDGNRQVRCASGKKCGNPRPVEESSHRCGGTSLFSYETKRIAHEGYV